MANLGACSLISSPSVILITVIAAFGIEGVKTAPRLKTVMGVTGVSAITDWATTPTIKMSARFIRIRPRLSSLDRRPVARVTPIWLAPAQLKLAQVDHPAPTESDHRV